MATSSLHCNTYETYYQIGHEDDTKDRGRGSPVPLDQTRSPSPAILGPWLPKPSRAVELKKLTGFRNENLPLSNRPDFEKQQPITRLILKTSKLDSSSPVPPGSGHTVIRPSFATTSHQRRSRPETSHQKAVNQNRKMRIDSILHKKLVRLHGEVRRRKRDQTSTSIYSAMSRIIDLPEDYDTEDESSWGPGGLVPTKGEESDFGGEALMHKKVIDRAQRRLAREDNGGLLPDISHAHHIRSRRPEFAPKDEPHEMDLSGRTGKDSGSHEPRLSRRDGHQPTEEEPLDDLDLDLLGEGREEDRAEDESMDDSGMDGSEDGDTEDDLMDTR